MDYTFLLGELESLLGKGQKRSRSNYAFHCPFCNHRKPKLEINLETDNKGHNHFACWVCETRGLTIYSLLKQLKVPKDKANQVLKYVPKSSGFKEEISTSVELPKEFQPLIQASKESIIGNKIRRYLNARGISDIDFIKYNIGYATTGDYRGRIIIPSYSGSNQLNFFVARTHEGSYFKYKNPEASKDIIFFENHINWNLPIVLCEGVFDAIAIRRNAIPILGKSISNSLYKKIISSPLKDVYIALDNDAKKKAFKIGEQLLNQGKRVFLIDLPQKDPSEMGFKNFTQLIQQAQKLELKDILRYKLEL